MPTTLSESVRAYFEAANSHDADALIACFAADAVVRDDGEDIHDRSAIRAWSEATTAKYHASIVPGAVEQIDGRTVVTTQVSGTFEGSPVALRFCFRLAHEQIAALEIVV